MDNIWTQRLKKIGLQSSHLLIICMLIAFVSISYATDVIQPVFLAVVAAYLMERPVRWMQKIGFARTQAVCFALLVAGALLWWLIAAMLPLVWSQGQAFLSALPELAATGRAYLEQFWSAQGNWFSERQLTLLLQRLESQTLSFLNTLVASSVSGVAGVFSALVYVVLLPMMVFFLLKDKVSLLADLQQKLPGLSNQLQPVWRELDHQLLGYIQGKLIELIVLTVSCYILFYVFALPFALLLALLVGFSVFIPYIGIAVVTVPVVLVVIGQWGLGSTSSWLMLIYLLLQLLDAYVLVPLLFGRVVDINPFYILLAVLVFGGLFGFWGVVLAIPLASLIKVVLHNVAPASG